MNPASELEEGMETVRKLLGLALIAAIIAGVKRYLDSNPDARRQVKEQANKAMGQAKHLAEEAGEKVKARAQAQDVADRPLSGSDTTTPVATPNGPTTGAPTTL
jgi:hypothetical protein